jgi:hypothetical protein
MSLSAREQHVLDSIKDELTGSDPKLAGLMATFTRLVSGEEMPLRERIWSGSRRVRHRLGPGRGTVLLLCLLVSVVLIGVAVILSHGTSGSTNGCVQPWPSICAGPASSHRPQPHKAPTSQPSAVTQLIPGG